MVGAGQLARMTHQAALQVGIHLHVLAESADAPAVLAGAQSTVGSASDLDALRSLAERTKVLTFDHELVPAELLDVLDGEGFRSFPGAPALRMAQDKLLARRTLGHAGFPVPEALELRDDPVSEARRLGERWGWPIVLKTRRGGYDGRGVEIVGVDDLDRVLGAAEPGEWLAEQCVEIALEIAVVGVRTPSGRWAAYPVVETTQVDGMCRELVMPARISAELAEQAQALAKSVADGIDATGIIAVELFVTGAGALVVNELAVRPHNSGHATIEGSVTSQFENHLRAVLDLPIGATSLVAPAVAMVNVVGPENGSDPRDHLARAMEVSGAHIHLYDKEARPGRKLGHVTALGPDHDAALAIARRCADLLAGVEASELVS